MRPTVSTSSRSLGRAGDAAAPGKPPAASRLARAGEFAASGASDDGSSVRSGGTSATAGTAPPIWRTMGRADLTPFGRKLVHMLLPRVWAAVRQVPPQVAVEVHRSFQRADQDRSGYIESNEVRALLSDIRGKSVTEADARGFLRLVDKDGDGQLSEQEVLMGLARLPQKRIPVEHDLEGVVCGELVASVMEMLEAMSPRVEAGLEGSDLAQALLDQATGAAGPDTGGDPGSQVRRAPGPATVVPVGGGAGAAGDGGEMGEMGEMPSGLRARGSGTAPGASGGGTLRHKGSFLLSSAPARKGGLFSLVGQLSHMDDDDSDSEEQQGALLGNTGPDQREASGDRAGSARAASGAVGGGPGADLDLGKGARRPRPSRGGRRASGAIAMAALDPEERERLEREEKEEEERQQKAAAAIRRARRRA